MADLTVSGKTEMQVTHADQVKIELVRGQRGSYGWTITAYGANLAEAISRIRSADSSLDEPYGLQLPNGNGSTE